MKFKKRFDGFLLVSFLISFAALAQAQANQCPDKFKVFDERRGWICGDGDASAQGFSTAYEIFEGPSVGSGQNDRGDFGFSESYENPNYQPVGIIGTDDRRPMTWEETRRAAVGVVGCNGSWGSGSVVYQGNLVVTAKHVFFRELTNESKCSGKKMYFQVKNPETRTRNLYNIIRLHTPSTPLPVWNVYRPVPADQSDVLVAELDGPVEEFTPSYLPNSIEPFITNGELRGGVYHGFFNDLLKGGFPAAAPGTLYFSGSAQYPLYFKGVPDLFVTDIDMAGSNMKGPSGGPIQVAVEGLRIIVGIVKAASYDMDGEPFNSSSDPAHRNFNTGVVLTNWLHSTLLSLKDSRFRQYHYLP